MASLMRNMHMRHQQKDQKIQELTSRLSDLEKKVEAMEEFEKSLVKTMVNPDMKEIVETVKEQRERILELEKKVREKEEEVEQAEALLDEMNDEKEEERVTPAMLRLRGINVTLARGDEVRETTNPASETDSGKDDLVRRMENGGGKPPAPLADILRANIGLTVQRPAVKVKEEMKVTMRETRRTSHRIEVQKRRFGRPIQLTWQTYYEPGGSAFRGLHQRLPPPHPSHSIHPYMHMTGRKALRMKTVLPMKKMRKKVTAI